MITTGISTPERSASRILESKMQTLPLCKLFPFSSTSYSFILLTYIRLGRRLKNNGQLDFNDPASVKQLTKSLLKRDFGVAIDLPDDRLCPPVC